MEGKQKLKAISRIHKDLKEIEENPIQGLSICMPDENDPFSLHCNIKILSGIYEGIILHLEMKIPDNYPIKAPKLKISAGQPFDHTFHHHVFDMMDGLTICIDLLDHGFFDYSQQSKTGWTPAYTLSTILVQMQVFFASDYDLPELPSQNQLSYLRSKLSTFSCPIKLTDGTFQTHSFNTPYPPFTQSPQVTPPQVSNETIERMKKAYSKMTCFTNKTDPSDDDTILGYPLALSRDAYGRTDMLPILEILSYDGFIMQIQEFGDKLDDFDSCHLRTAMGLNFNYWFPFYVNEKMYLKNKQIYYNAISVLKFGVKGKKEFDFEPELILKVFPILLNKTIVALQSGSLYQSSAAIEGYCHLLRLFLRFLEDFPYLYQKINEKIEKAMQNEEARNKNNLGDMGEFLILLSLSKYGLQHKGVWLNLIKEFMARKFLWVIKDIKGGKNIFSPNDLERLNESPLALFHGMTTENLKNFYKARKIANDLLLFNFAAARKFLSNKEEFIKNIDFNFGVIDEQQVNEFITQVNEIKNNIQTYEQLIDFIGLKDKIGQPKQILNLFREAHQLSYMQGYTNIFAPNSNQSCLLKTDHFLILTQWFIKNERNLKFFNYLMNNKNMVFALKEYLQKLTIGDENAASAFDDFKLPGHFFEYIRDTRFFLENLLSKKFFFDFLTLMETSKYTQNSCRYLNKLNCLSPFHRDDEFFNKTLNFEGIIKSSIWMMVHSFHNLFTALPYASRGKIVHLQMFAFFYRVFLKNLAFWRISFARFIDQSYDTLLKTFQKDVEALKGTSEFDFLNNNQNEIFLCLIVIGHIIDRLGNKKVYSVKEITRFTEIYLRNNENKDEVIKKMMILSKTMIELDSYNFEPQMDQNLYIFDREKSFKIINSLMGYNFKRLEELL